MPLLDMPLRKHRKRQDPPALTSVDGFGGAVTAAPVDSSTPTGPLILASGTESVTIPTDNVPLSHITLTVSSTAAPTSDAASASASPTSNTSAMKGSDALAMSTVIAICVGAFIGLALLICLFIWWTRHPSTKSRGMPRSPIEQRNTRAREDQARAQSEFWDRLSEDDKAAGGASARSAAQMMSQQEIDEKNFSMFKKRSNSTRTTKTTKLLQEHGFDMPPVELSKYHPGLAKEYALQEPERPFAQRQESGISWDGETLGDDSFLSIRSGRIDSGTMSPTLGMAKMTPPAMPSTLHRWESAEVLTIEETAVVQNVGASSSSNSNPFSDAHDERRKSRGANPFFNAGEVHRASGRRSRSNSRGQSLSREPSRTSRSTIRARVVSEAHSTIDPFADLQDAASTPQIALPPESSHAPNEGAAGGDSEHTFAAPDLAMQSLIAALDLGQEIEDRRLRVASMQPSTASRYSFAEDDVGIARDYPPTPSTAGPSGAI